MLRAILVASLALILSLASPVLQAAEPAFSPDDAAKALHKAVEFFRTQVAVEGGYVYVVSEDLTERDGEVKATPKQIWIQPPGTPAVGLAYLDCYALTKNKYYLEAARETAEALIRTQLRSGGWWGLAEFDPAEREKDHDYRIDPPGKQPKRRRSTTLDDNKTQACLRFLIRLDKLLEFKDAKLHECTRYALDHLASAQFPNGAWPQEFDGPPDPMKFPVKPASYPETWSREFPKEKYSGRYTFNDNAMADAIDVMLEAGATYEEPHYTNAAIRCGEFIVMAQMPEPQPAWAQQYDVDMHPAWARKFEPPSITGGESQQLLGTLMYLYRATGDEKFMKPIPPAIAYLRRSIMPNGMLARFYELQTNKPLYFTKTYELTYSDADLPTHYGFKISHKLDYLEAEYKKLMDPKREKAPLTYGLKMPRQFPGSVLLDIDRTKCMTLGVELNAVSEALQPHFKGSSVDDFEKTERSWRVNLDPAGKVRVDLQLLEKIKVRTTAGQMVPLRAVATIKQSAGSAQPNPGSAKDAEVAAKGLDARGAWVTEGKMDHAEEKVRLIDSRVFIKNVVTLARYAGAK